METLSFELFLWIWGLLLYLVAEIVWGIDKVVFIYGLWEVCLNWFNVIQLFHKFGFCTVCLLRKCGIGNATVCCWDGKYWILNIYCKFCNLLLNGSRMVLAGEPKLWVFCSVWLLRESGIGSLFFIG